MDVREFTSNGHTFAVTEGACYPLTPCCKASGKGSNSSTGVACRKCYREVAVYYGDLARTKSEFVRMTDGYLLDFVAEAVWVSLVKL